MKLIKLSLYLILAATFVACQNDDSKTVDTNVVNNPQTASEDGGVTAMPVMKFEQELFDFGTITQGEKVNLTYKFTNTGNADLIISTAKGSCGCTVPDWPKEPIKPGESGEIKVIFNSDGRNGNQHKTVSINANTQPALNEVAFKGIVVAPEVETTEG
ncbi:MAG: hypothetical protein CL840_11210 [Crocinitomicaceae bacterium]|nr:hypothetical protein [Crocinitomicaceae bacterium]|tara:strand:+ start:10420 stop:10893 length:474 start_codon:yes stop_codon:yes gene_type:complete